MYRLQLLASCIPLMAIFCVQTGAISESQFGKHGILRKSDLANKHSEFQAWAIEVSGLQRLPQQPPKLLMCGAPAMHASGCVHSCWHGAQATAWRHCWAWVKGRRGRRPPRPRRWTSYHNNALVASQVKKANVEALPKWEEEELLGEFMEEFNTATLPHKKYYNLEVYERERAMKAAKRGAGTGVSWHLPTGLHGCQAVGGQCAGVGVLIACPHSGCRCPYKPAWESVQATCECGQAGCGHRGDHGLSALMTATAGVQAQGSARLTPS